MKFLAVDLGAAESIISNRELQSNEFIPGKTLALFLTSESAFVKLPPDVHLVEAAGGVYLVSTGEGSDHLFIIDLLSAAVFQGWQHSEQLLIFQHLLRFAVRYWKRQRLSRSQTLIPNSTKAVIFPLPISTKTSFRISIEREPDQKRLAKRGLTGKYLLVYKCGTAEGAGPNETAGVTQFRKALEKLEAVRRKVELGSTDEAVSGLDIAALSVTELSPEDTDSIISPYQTYDRWTQLLTEPQKRFVTSPLKTPSRIEGPAGTGKTLCLALKCIHLLKRAKTQNVAHNSTFITHSEATCQAINVLFESNDNERFFSRDRYTYAQSLNITTLHTLCAEILTTKISETEFLDRDAMDSKELQLLLVNESVEEAFQQDFQTHKRFLSSSFREFLETEDNWSISEMMQHEISVVIKGRANEAFEKYKNLPSLKYGLPVKSESDRGLVFIIFQKYQDKLKAAAQFDTDDVVLSAVGQLNTPIWRRRRATEGYDAVFVDETHLFNMNELSMFHYLTRQEGSYPIVYSVDRSQALGDRGWGSGTIASAISSSTSPTKGREERIRVLSVFRCSRDIVNLAFSVTSSGATLFTNFDDPMQLAASAFTEREERKCVEPKYFSYPNDEAMVEAAFVRAESMVDEMNVSKAEVLIAAFNKDVLGKLRDLAGVRNKPVEIVTRRGDVEVTKRAKKAGRLVIGHADYVGGLEFAGAVLVGVDNGRVPPSKEESREESKNFLSYTSHNRLYVAITRAKYRIEILGVDSYGPSKLLQAAFQTGALQREMNS